MNKGKEIRKENSKVDMEIVYKVLELKLMRCMVRNVVEDYGKGKIIN